MTVTCNVRHTDPDLPIAIDRAMITPITPPTDPKIKPSEGCESPCSVTGPAAKL